ncbi:capsular polysaccharide synthesis protein [Loigolactobacillus coryniformis subsp. coryniformis]
MRDFKMVLAKFDWRELISEYLHSHTLIYMCRMMIVNGTDKTSLELIRNGQLNKVKKLLKRKYKNTINQPLNSNVIQKHSDYVWICWFQGLESSPEIVKTCVDSIVKHFPEKEIKIITAENIEKYVRIPDVIHEKWEKGIISNAHFSDILRVLLLIKYGGIWIDATVFMSFRDNNLMATIDRADLFFFQKLKPGRDGHAIYLSSWFMSSVSNNPILQRTLELLLKYWENHNYLLNYFLFHIFLQITLDSFSSYMNDIPKYDSGLPHLLLFQLNNKYDELIYKDIINRSPVNKLTYKNIDLDKEDTVYKHILKLK